MKNNKIYFLIFVMTMASWEKKCERSHVWRRREEIISVVKRDLGNE